MKLVDEYGMYERLSDIMETDEDDPLPGTEDLHIEKVKPENTDETNVQADRPQLRRIDSSQEELFINAKT